MPSDLEKQYSTYYPNQSDPEKTYSDLERAYGTILNTTKTVAKAGAKKAMQVGGDVIGPPVKLLGSAMEYPVAQGAHAMGGMQGHKMPPVTFSPTSGVEQFKATGMKHPELADLGANLALAGPMNAIGEGALMPLARAALEPIRGLPGISSALEFSKTGASLPAKYRQPFQGILRTEEGKLDLSVFNREAALSQYRNLPLASQERIQTAIERRATQALAPEEKAVADALEAEYASRPGERVAAGRTPHELGAHIGQAEEAARQARLQFMAKRGLATQAQEMEVPNPFGGKGYRVAKPLESSGAQWLSEGVGPRVRNTVPTPIPSSPTEPHTFGLSETTIAARRNQAAQAATRMRQLEREATKASQGVPESQRVAFTDRPLSPEARAEMGIKRYGSATPSGLSTGGLGRRFANPGKTTAEINAELIAEGKTPIGPVVQSALEAGERSDIGNMHARIVRSLMDQFGEPTTDPMQALSKHPGLRTGFDQATTKRLETTKLPPQLDKMVERLNQRLAPQEWGKTQEAVQWLNRGFKKWALFSPGYTSRNLQNNLFQIGMFEVNGPQDIPAAMRAGATVAKPDPAKTEEWIKMGVVGRGQTSREIARGGGITGMARNVNSGVEDKSRAFLYELRLAKGDTPEQAARRVDDLLFNYSQRFASRARREIGRNYIPFVNWSAFVPGLTARTFLERPGTVAALGNMRARQNQKEGYTDERLSQEFGPWELPKGAIATGEGKGVEPQFAGQYSTNDLVPSGVQNAVDNLAEKLYPTMKVPLGLYMNRDPFSGRTFGDRGKDRFTKAPSSLRAAFLFPGGREAMAKLGVTEDPETKELTAPARLVYVLRAFPQIRLPDLIADYAAGVKGKETPASSFGLGVRNLTKYEPKGKGRH